MDSELKHLTLNVSQLAALSGVHRQTVAARLKNIRPEGGNDTNLRLYSLTAVLSELMKMPPPVAESEMAPQDRKAWYQSERERLKFEQEVGELIPAAEVAREFAEMAKAMIQVFETMPDILERDCALSPAAVSRVQHLIDDLRDDIARRISSDPPETENDGEA